MVRFVGQAVFSDNASTSNLNTNVSFLSSTYLENNVLSILIRPSIPNEAEEFNFAVWPLFAGVSGKFNKFGSLAAGTLINFAIVWHMTFKESPTTSPFQHGRSRSLGLNYI